MLHVKYVCWEEIKLLEKSLSRVRFALVHKLQKQTLANSKCAQAFEGSDTSVVSTQMINFWVQKDLSELYLQSRNLAAGRRYKH